MVSSLYKWSLLFLGFLLISAYRPMPNHPLHLSVVEINHNPGEKTLEISCKIFTDDFEKILAKNYQTRVDLITPADRKPMDKLISDYIAKHLSVAADGKQLTFSYLGFERENEVIYSYVQVENVATVSRIDVVNTLMHDMFDDQINMMHVIVGGKRKSSKLDYPGSKLTVSF